MYAIHLYMYQLRAKLGKSVSNGLNVATWKESTCSSILLLHVYYYMYQLIAGIDHVPYQHPPYNLLLLQIIHEYARGSENICLAY
jgi:hypothetical protein